MIRHECTELQGHLWIEASDVFKWLKSLRYSLNLPKDLKLERPGKLEAEGQGPFRSRFLFELMTFIRM